MKSGWVVRPGAAEFPHENTLLDCGALWIGNALSSVEIADGAVKPSKPRAFSRVRALAPPMRTEPILPPPLPSEGSPCEVETAEGMTPRQSAPAREETVETRPAHVVEMTVAPVETTVPAVTAVTPAVTTVPPAEIRAAGGESCDERIETFVRAIADVARAHGPAETAAHVESLFKFGTPAPLDLSPNAREALLDGNILEATDGGVHATAWFTRTSSAWQSMLRGETGNFAAECGESTLDGWTADLIARLVAKPSMASAIRRDLRRRGIAAFGMLDS